MPLKDSRVISDDSSSESEVNGNDDDQDQSQSPNDDSESDAMEIESDEIGSDTRSVLNDDKPPSCDSSELKQKDEKDEQDDLKSASAPKKITRNAKIRDLLIFKEINNDRLPTMLPPTLDLIFPDPSELHIFKIKVTPSEGYWNGGTFFFDVFVPEEYNFEPPKVKCTTKIWHPNIAEDGSVCLSILRSHAIDETGWNPARQLKDVILGINSIFTDLVNFLDPLNNEAAEMFRQDPRHFQRKVKEYIEHYADKNAP